MNSGSRSSPKPSKLKGMADGMNQYEMMNYATLTLGSGNLWLAVLLPDGEDINEWVAFNSKCPLNCSCY